MFEGKANLSGAPLLGRLLWLYPQILDWAGVPAREKHSSLLRTFGNYAHILYKLVPGKVITKHEVFSFFYEWA
jgi:hypothetical protein